VEARLPDRRAGRAAVFVDSARDCTFESSHHRTQGTGESDGSPLLGSPVGPT
jgi:hypothetical protein